VGGKGRGQVEVGWGGGRARSGRKGRGGGREEEEEATRDGSREGGKGERGVRRGAGRGRMRPEVLVAVWQRHKKQFNVLVVVVGRCGGIGPALWQESEIVAGSLLLHGIMA